ncbi:hypothetical protein [Helicobacter cynogastricus]|uniref:hypothetical protein n=1 Tax=Helicobacter cynogastricus TaxID=329937 RepID=UPI000CF0FA09|nr:hypothetical protein [Helicobacter cynogastricus]
MPLPDISAGRGGLAAFSESLGHLRGAHAHLANTMSQFNAHINQSMRDVVQMANVQEAKKYQQMRDKIADSRYEKEAAFREQARQDALAHQQFQKDLALRQANAQDRVFDRLLNRDKRADEQWDKTYQLQKQTTNAQTKLLGAQTYNTNMHGLNMGLDIYDQANTIKTSNDSKNVMFANFVQNQIYKPKGKKPKSTTPIPAPTGPNFAAAVPFARD